MTVFVIGAGWYGCHIALTLLQAGHDVRIVDKANRFFAGSSAKNQNRLHLGYHYPRSAETIAECQRGFAAFKTAYPTLSSPIPNNLYLIASDPENQTTITGFARQFEHPGELLCIAGRTPFSQIRNVRPTMFPVAEEFIDNAAAAQHFQHALSHVFLPIADPAAFESVEALRGVLSVVTAEAGEEAGDWLINCTYNHLDPLPMSHYELYCSLVYQIPSPETFGITIMDGAYFSIYPYQLDEHLYTLTSVEHGVVWRGTDRTAAPSEKDVEGRVETLRSLVEAEVEEVLPEFGEKAQYMGWFTSWKTKPSSEDDDRSLRMDVAPGMIRVYGGKITGMFDAAERVLGILGPRQAS